MTLPASEKRKFARLDLALSVSYVPLGAHQPPQDPREALSSDISQGGLRLMTPTALPVGTELELQITLEGNEHAPIVATGEVVWQNKLSPTSFETGVTIQTMPTADRSRFMQFVFDQMSKLVGSTAVPV
ncbi:MAG: PilZ domain-containing protein [Deltaproteobacteria bacterium]|nr:PilZ domain-containing protein [Deltaproteobacteria bacterium]